MNKANGAAGLGVLLAVLIFAMYARRLSDTPMYMSPDEVIISVDAQSIASTGRDVDGRFLPLFFNIQMPGEDRKGWFFPMIFYLSALVLNVLPPAEATARVPTVLVGVIDVVLMFFLARALFSSDRFGLFAAALLALSPSHFLLSRLGLDYLYPLPFTLAWLLCLVRFAKIGRRRTLYIGTLILGLGFYSYIASVLLMPLYLALTCLFLLHARTPGRVIGTAIAVFCLPLLALIPWIIAHPTALIDTLGRYELGASSFVSFTGVEQLTSRYWSFFNPSVLFLTGDQQMMFSTRLAGVFLVSTAFFLAAGLYYVVAVRPTPFGLLGVAGFVTAPLVALLVPEDGALHRAVGMLGFGVLLAAFGLEYLLSVRCLGRRVGVAAVLVLIALMPVQFWIFDRDYFGSYRLRSGPWFGGNLRGALERMIALDGATPVPAVYFSTLRAGDGRPDIANRWMDAYWKFYLAKQRRRDLLTRTAKLDPASLGAVPAGSLVLANAGDPVSEGLITSGELTIVERIPEADREPFFMILRR